MDEHSRPNPDELLARVQAAEKKKARGQLKIFLGYAAGVGKTYAMLEAAHECKSAGVDVVVAYVKTHGRKETEALLAGLETIPCNRIEYRDRILPEADVDAVLARKPQLALVDELAHTNIPGSRHPKRYQDVEELLSASIDVYTTLNVQHLESLNDVVAKITGITVHETIPDRVLEQADEIELIDLPPNELLQRLKDGKVYIPTQAARAIERFFRMGNLTALRELSLRRVAARVDDQMRDYMTTRAIPGPWPAAERLLVCISPSALSERLIRTARRLAEKLKAEWYALYIETPDQVYLSATQRDRIARLLHLAEELGAQVQTIPSPTIAESVIRYARAHNITKIIAGKPMRSRWRELLHGAVVNQIIRQSGDIDVYVISGETEPLPMIEAEPWQPHRPLRRYLLSLAVVAAITLLGAPIHGTIAPTNLVMLYLAGVVIAALYLGRGPSIFAAILSVLAFDFIFVPPYLTFAISDTQYLLTFAGLLVVSLVISTLTVRVREQMDATQHRAAQTEELYKFSRDLATALSLDDILHSTIEHVGQTFSRAVAILLPEGATLQPCASSPDFELTDSEIAVARWAFEHGEPAGRSTTTLPAATVRCLPFKTAQGIIGVLCVKPADPNLHLTPEQRRLMESFASQAALAIERTQLADQVQQAQVLQATEKLQTALLNSISHDLRTPLVSITGALTSLQEDRVNLDAATCTSLIENARGEAERLNRLVGNLLDMTRLESGARLEVNLEPVDIEDLIGAVLEQLAGRLDERTVQVEIPRDLPLVPLDFRLMVQVLGNLIDNALKYSPSDTPIEIRAQADQSNLEIKIADRGVGIPSEDLTRVFDKFYRVQRPNNVSGTGMGLSICKGFVEAHGGTIWAENRASGGTIIHLTLPRLILPLSKHIVREVQGQ